MGRKKQFTVSSRLKSLKAVWGLVPAMLIWLLFTPPAIFALEFDLGKNYRLDWENTLSYGLSFRTEDADGELLSNANGDDGNRSFDKWDAVTNRFKIISEADLSYQENYGLFARGRAWYDFAYTGSNAHDSPATHNNSSVYGGELTDTQEFTDKIEEEYGYKAELLDLFAYGQWDLGGHSTVLRVGRQVVSWGESLFIANSISSAQSPIDTRDLNTPGTELKDIFLPTGQVYGSIDLVADVNLSGYYKWEWEASRLDEGGTFYSTNDFLDENGHRILVAPPLPATIDRVGDDDASDGGEWGVGLRYLAGWLNDTEFGLYYLNYHETLPQLITQPGVGGSVSTDWASSGLPASVWQQLAFADASSYKLAYAEDIKLYGFSFGTVIGDTNVAGELSYRQDFPVPVVNPANPLGPGYEDGDVLQFQASAIHSFSPTFLWDNATFTAEVGWNQVSGVDAELLNDKSAWGYTARFAPDYFNILSGLDLNVPITFKQGVNGDSSVQGTFTENANSLAVGLNFTYNQVWECDLSYVTQFGDPDDNLKTDRDTVGFVFKRTF